MTEKIYETNSHQKECETVVRACESVEGGYEVLLERTVLFPEGGGQPSDEGTIDEARVSRSREEKGEVWHLCDRMLAIGARVTVRLNWARRFDFMQQHTGEHLLSFAFHKLFGANNIGFHLASDYTTIDFDKPISHEQIVEAERLANEYVWRNLPVTIAFYDSDAAVRALPLRKHAEGLSAPIRVVAVEDADMCTCCAPHCARTGEIGSIFVLDAVPYKGGARVTFHCGGRALASHRAAHDDLDAIARRFSTARENAAAAVAKMSDEFGQLKKREKELSRALGAYEAAELRAGAERAGHYRLAVRLLAGVDTNRLKDVAQATAETGLLAVLFSEGEGRLSYVVASGEGFPLDAGEIAAAVNAATGGKGGGRGTLAQGTAAASAGTQETVGQIRDYLARRLKELK